MALRLRLASQRSALKRGSDLDRVAMPALETMGMFTISNFC
jgi:hypothetical protein